MSYVLFALRTGLTKRNTSCLAVKKVMKVSFQNSVLINKLVEFGHSVRLSNQLFFKNLIGPT